MHLRLAQVPFPTRKRGEKRREGRKGMKEKGKKCLLRSEKKGRNILMRVRSDRYDCILRASKNIEYILPMPEIAKKCCTLFSDGESRNLFSDFIAYTPCAISKVPCGDTTKIEFLISYASTQMTEKFEVQYFYAELCSVNYFESHCWKAAFKIWHSQLRMSFAILLHIEQFVFLCWHKNGKAVTPENLGSFSWISLKSGMNNLQCKKSQDCINRIHVLLTQNSLLAEI